MISQEQSLLFYTAQAGLANRLEEPFSDIAQRWPGSLPDVNCLLCWAVDDYCIAAPFADVFENAGRLCNAICGTAAVSGL